MEQAKITYKTIKMLIFKIKIFSLSMAIINIL